MIAEPEDARRSTPRAWRRARPSRCPPPKGKRKEAEEAQAGEAAEAEAPSGEGAEVEAAEESPPDGGASEESETRPRIRGLRSRGRGRGFRGSLLISRPTNLVPKPTTGRGAFLELVVIVALAIGLALLIQAFIVKPYQIPSGSMEPTLDPGQRVLVNRLIYHFRDPEIGDIVVFHPPVGADREQCGVEPAPGRAVSPADFEGLRHQLHQADRGGTRRPADDPRRPPGGQRRSRPRRTSSSPVAAATAATCRTRSRSPTTTTS